MNKQQINLRIAELRYPEAKSIKPDSINFCNDGEGVLINVYGNHASLVDYCNNIADLWPLMLECCDNFYVDTFWAEVRYKNKYFSEKVGEKPQLALAKCVLAVLEAKEKENG